MTSPYARPVEPPEDASADATIPLVPEYGYDQPTQPPFAEETLVEPLSTSQRPDLYGEQYGYTPTPTSHQPAAAGYPSAADYWQGATAASAGTSPASTHEQPYRQPTYDQPRAAGSGSAQPNTGYAQPMPAQSNYTQPGYASGSYVEPSGPAGSIAPQPAYQAYPTPAQVPAVPYTYGYQQSLPDHPSATTTFVLSLIGIFVLQILSPIAWYLGAKAQREVKANPGRWRSGGLLTAGTVIGIIGTVFMAVIAVFLLFVFFMVVLAAR